MSAILRALNNARDFIAQHPQEAAKIITEKKYSTITDQKLAVQLFKDYDYAVQPDEGKLIKNDVGYFSAGLKKIGFLKTNDPAAFSTKIYKHIDQ
jgi:NitT/TauT family transport system substrate-binding protein